MRYRSSTVTSESASENWREMHRVLADSTLSMGAINVLLRHYESLSEVVKKGAYYLSSSNGCGDKAFGEIADYLFENGFTSERWDADTIAKDRKKLSESEKEMLRERFFEGLTVEQIGKRHGITKQCASQALVRANAKAARLYILNEVDSNDG